MKIRYTFANGETSEIEVEGEIGDIIIESRKKEHADDERERYHTAYSIDQALFEGSDLAADDSVEEKYINTETGQYLSEALQILTDKQRRRLIMSANGMSLRAIAAAEGISDHKKISKSIEAAKNKIKKFMK